LLTVKCWGDKGYQGIKKNHRFSQIPHKKPKGGHLNKEQKQENSQLASLRIVVEHVNSLFCDLVLSKSSKRLHHFSKQGGIAAGIVSFMR
jgi:hypothetical protein